MESHAIWDETYRKYLERGTPFKKHVHGGRMNPLSITFKVDKLKLFPIGSASW